MSVNIRMVVVCDNDVVINTQEKEVIHFFPFFFFICIHTIHQLLGVQGFCFFLFFFYSSFYAYLPISFFFLPSLSHRTGVCKKSNRMDWWSHLTGSYCVLDAHVKLAPLYLYYCRGSGAHWPAACVNICSDEVDGPFPIIKINAVIFLLYY